MGLGLGNFTSPSRSIKQSIRPKVSFTSVEEIGTFPSAPRKQNIFRDDNKSPALASPASPLPRHRVEEVSSMPNARTVAMRRSGGSSSRRRIVLRPEDVVCGRGDQHASQSGNVRFYRLIDEHLELYVGAATKFEKSRVVQAIYRAVAPGRFVKRQAGMTPTTASDGNGVRAHDGATSGRGGINVDGDEHVQQVDDKEARQKISHALRYRLKTRNAAAAARSAAATGENTHHQGERGPQQQQQQQGREQRAQAAGRSVGGHQDAMPRSHNRAPPPPAAGAASSGRGGDDDGGGGLFSNGELFSVLGDSSVFRSTQFMTRDRLLRLFRQDRRDRHEADARSSSDVMIPSASAAPSTAGESMPFASSTTRDASSSSSAVGNHEGDGDASLLADEEFEVERVIQAALCLPRVPTPPPPPPACAEDDDDTKPSAMAP